MLRSKKLLKFKRAVSAVTAVLLTISCLGFDYDVSAAGEPATTEVPTDFENPPIMSVIDPIWGTGTASDTKLSISLVEGTSTSISISSEAMSGTITCSSSDPSVATIDQNGTVTAYKAGTATLKYLSVVEGEDGGHFWQNRIGYTVSVTVTSATIEVTGITVNQSSYELTKGSTATISYSVQPADATDKNVTWTSSDASVATCSNGVIQAVGAGTATITGRTSNGVTATVYVTVTALPEAIRISSSTMGLKKGESSSLTYTISPAGVTDNVTWSSSDTSVATVDNYGKVTAKKSGTAVITVSTSNGYTDSCTVVVTSEIESIQFTESKITLDIGKEKQLEVIITPADVPNADVTLTVSDPTVVSIDANGKIRALKAGTATITARTANNKTATCTVTVNKAAPEKITVSPASKTVNVGETFSVAAQITPAEAANDKLTWSSNNTSVAVVDANGKVTAKAVGTATINVKTSNGKTATCTVTVKNIEATSVKVTPATVTLEVGKTQTVAAKVAPDKADQSVTWTSSNSSVATVSSSGVITAKAVGTANITAKTKNGKTATVAVTVKAVEAASVTISAASNSCTVGSTVTLTAKVSPDKASQSVTWTSDNTSVATVSSSGVVTGKAVGRATITAKTSNGKTATYSVTVTPVEAASVVINAASKELAQGATFTLRATVSPSNATDKSVTWTSSNANVASVDATGKVIAKAAGKATITAKTSNGKTAVCTITVTETAVESITFDKTTAQMNVDETMTLTATVAPANAGNKNLTWFSNNESVLTVTASGQVKAVGAGKATITAKSANGKIAMCVITVVDPSSYEVVFTNEVKDIHLGETSSVEYENLPEGIIPEFESMNQSIVSVDSKGNVTGKKVGSTAVRARVGKGKWSIMYVYVLPTQSEVDVARQKFAEDVLYYVNIERAKEGLAPLQLMDELSYLAQIRTDEQAAVRTISHTRPDGRKWSTVFGETRSPMPKKASAENLVQSAGYTAEGCVKAWMNSKGHRDNILRPNMTHMGIGVEFTNMNLGCSYIVTQLFIQYNG